MPDARIYKPHDEVPYSGVYDVIHDKNHRVKHQVTCVAGKPFPPCRGCGSEVRFQLAVKATHIKDHPTFR